MKLYVATESVEFLVEVFNQYSISGYMPEWIDRMYVSTGPYYCDTPDTIADLIHDELVHRGVGTFVERPRNGEKIYVYGGFATIRNTKAGNMSVTSDYGKWFVDLETLQKCFKL